MNTRRVLVMALALAGCATEPRRPSVAETQARFAQEDHDEECATGDAPDEECVDYKRRVEDRRQRAAWAAAARGMAAGLNPPKLSCVSRPQGDGTVATECR